MYDWFDDDLTCFKYERLVNVLNVINNKEMVGINPKIYLKNLKYLSKEKILNYIINYFETIDLGYYVTEKIKSNEIKIYDLNEADGEMLLKCARCRKVDDKFIVFLPLSYTMLDIFLGVHEITHFLILNNKYNSDLNQSRYFSEIEPTLAEYNLKEFLLKQDGLYLEEIENVIRYRKCVYQSHVTRFINYLYFKNIITKNERIEYGIISDNFSNDLINTTDIKFSFRYVLATMSLLENLHKQKE